MSVKLITLVQCGSIHTHGRKGFHTRIYKDLATIVDTAFSFDYLCNEAISFGNALQGAGVGLFFRVEAIHLLVLVFECVLDCNGSARDEDGEDGEKDPAIAVCVATSDEEVGTADVFVNWDSHQGAQRLT